MESDRYRGLLPGDVIGAIARNGLQFDPTTETGTVLHMMGAVTQFGKLGMTCIGDSSNEARAIYQRVVGVLEQGAIGVLC